jgi:hypothetical protein
VVELDAAAAADEVGEVLVGNDDDGEVLALRDVMENDKDVLGVALAQNCSARFSAVWSSVGQLSAMHFIKPEVKFCLWIENEKLDGYKRGMVYRPVVLQKQLTSTRLEQFAAETASPKQLETWNQAGISTRI